MYVTGHTTPYGTVQDYFGNVLASISNNVVTWSGARYSSYGPVPGYQPPTISDGVPFGQILGWHGMRIDPDGNYHIGARRYDPLTGRFQSADPLGHASSMDLYSYCGGDPVNRMDPTGRFGKPVQNDFGQSGFDPNREALLDQLYGPVSERGRHRRRIGAIRLWRGFVAFQHRRRNGQRHQYRAYGTERHGPTGFRERQTWAAASVLLNVFANWRDCRSGYALRGTGDALIGAGDAGLIAESERVFAADTGVTVASSGGGDILPATIA